MRRERAGAVLGCLLGSALVLFSSGATWVSARVQSGGEDPGVVAAPLSVEWSGGTIAPAATALGLLGLAAAVAVVATRRVGRTIVGVLAAAAGIGILIVAGGIAVDPLAAVSGTDEVRTVAPAGDAAILDPSWTAAGWISCLGGLLLMVTGGLIAARGRSWPALSGRYQARGAVPADAWDAIERGHDPT